MIISSPTNGPLSFKPVTPDALAGQKIPVIPGSKIFGTDTGFALISYQVYSQSRYTLYIRAYHVKTDTSLSVKDEDTFLLFRVVLKNHIRYKCNGGNIYMKMGQFIFGYKPSVSHNFTLKAGQDYLVFEMRLAFSFAEELNPGNNLLENLQEKITREKCAWLTEHPAHSGALLQFAIVDLLAEPGNKGMVSRVLKELLEVIKKNKNFKIQAYKIEKMFNASELIYENIKKIKQGYDKGKLLSNKELASMVATNLRDFKVSFKRVFLMPPGEYSKRIQIRTAQFLLLNNPELTINEIAKMVGYSGSIAFTRQFKKLIEKTPAEFRQF